MGSLLPPPNLLHGVGAALGRALTHDFCPGANRWVYWMKKPIASLSLAMGAALLCAVFVKPIALVAAAAIAVVVALGYVWPSVAVRGLSATLRFHQPRVVEGDVARAEVTVRNRWPWPVWGVSLVGDLGGPASVALARVAGLSTATFTWEFIPQCRGCHPARPLTLLTGFPFGLSRAGRAVETVRPILVWPRTVVLETLLDAAETRPSSDLVSESRAGESGDSTGTRPFRDGDSLRRVHWPLTARLGTMVVSERQAPVLSAVRVVFDPEPALHDGVGPDGTLEHAIRIAASIATAYQRQHAAVECCFGHTILRVGPGEPGLRRFLDDLARFRPAADGESCPHGGHHSCRRIHHRNCGVFQVSIVTARSLARRVEHRHVHGDRLWIVFDTDPAGPRPTLPGRTLWLSGSIPEAFRRGWRNLCHAG
ncbi:MAG: DUF58 domain-containing protein [Planctomycetaceae bacterium]